MFIKNIKITAIAALAFLCSVQTVLAAMGSSTSYVLQLADLTNSGADASSATYNLVGVAGDNFDGTGASLSFNLCAGFIEEMNGGCEMPPPAPPPPSPPTPPPAPSPAPVPSGGGGGSGWTPPSGSTPPPGPVPPPSPVSPPPLSPISPTPSSPIFSPPSLPSEPVLPLPSIEEPVPPSEETPVMYPVQTLFPSATEQALPADLVFPSGLDLGEPSFPVPGYVLCQDLMCCPQPYTFIISSLQSGQFPAFTRPEQRCNFFMCCSVKNESLKPAAPPKESAISTTGSSRIADISLVLLLPAILLFCGLLGYSFVVIATHHKRKKRIGVKKARLRR